MNDLDGEPLKVGKTSFSLMGQIAQGGSELVTQGKTWYGAKYPDSFCLVSFRHPESVRNVSPPIIRICFYNPLKTFRITYTRYYCNLADEVQLNTYTL